MFQTQSESADERAGTLQVPALSPVLWHRHGAFMTTVAQYSSPEKKRIRKSFAKRPSVLNVPFLLATQLESDTAFLQSGVSPERRKSEGLQSAFASILPNSTRVCNS